MMNEYYRVRVHRACVCVWYHRRVTTRPHDPHPTPTPSRARDRSTSPPDRASPGEVSRSSRRSMVAYVMDDERMIKSAWTPEVRPSARSIDRLIFIPSSRLVASSRETSRRRERRRARWTRSRSRTRGRWLRNRAMARGWCARRARGRARGRRCAVCGDATRRDAHRRVVLARVVGRASSRATDDGATTAPRGTDARKIRSTTASRGNNRPTDHPARATDRPRAGMGPVDESSHRVSDGGGVVVFCGWGLAVCV